MSNMVVFIWCHTFTSTQYDHLSLLWVTFGVMRRTYCKSTFRPVRLVRAKLFHLTVDLTLRTLKSCLQKYIVPKIILKSKSKQYSPLKALMKMFVILPGVTSISNPPEVDKGCTNTWPMLSCSTEEWGRNWRFARQAKGEDLRWHYATEEFIHGRLHMHYVKMCLVYCIKRYFPQFSFTTQSLQQL